MASRRILATQSVHSLFFSFTAVFIAALLFIGCGTSSKSTRQEGQAPGNAEPVEDVEAGVSAEFLLTLENTRSKLSDVYSSSQNEMPALFNQKSSSRDIGDPYQGYRIQIISTRDVAKADSIAQDFRTWAQGQFNNYLPKAYVLYRQPYYKVHIGNFQFQDHAMQLNRILKSRYSDAWVVPDEVEPQLVPPEDYNFGMSETATDSLQ